MAEKTKVPGLIWTVLNHPDAKSYNNARFLQLVIGVFVASCVGSSYCFGIISNYLKEEYCLNQAQLTSISTAGAVAGYMSLPFGMLYDFAGPKPVLFLSGTLSALGFGMLALIFDGKIAFSLVGICAVNAITNLGTASMDTGSLMSNLYSFPLNRGECIIIQKTFMGLGATFLSLVYQGFFMDDGNYVGYATFVSGFVAVSLYLGALVTTLPDYHVVTLTKWRFLRETRRRMAKAETDDAAYTIEKDRQSEWGEIIEKSFSRSHASQLVDRRRFSFGLVCLWMTLIFFTTLAFVNSYVSLDKATRISMGVLAIALTMSFFGMMWPWDLPAFFDFPWLPSLTFDKEKFKHDRGYTPSARTGKSSNRESARSTTEYVGLVGDDVNRYHGVHTSVAATYAVSEAGQQQNVGSYSSSLQREGIPTYGDIAASRLLQDRTQINASRQGTMNGESAEASRMNSNQNQLPQHFAVGNTATGPAKKNPHYSGLDVHGEEENASGADSSGESMLPQKSEPIVCNSGSPISPTTHGLGAGASVAASARSGEGNDSLNGEAALLSTVSPNDPVTQADLRHNSVHQANSNQGSSNSRGYVAVTVGRENSGGMSKTAYLAARNARPPLSGDSTPTLSSLDYNSAARLEDRLREVAEKENKEKDRLLGGNHVVEDDDNGDRGSKSVLVGDLGMGATDVVLHNAAAMQTSFLHNLFKTPVLIGFWWINFAVWGTCSVFVNNVSQMYRSVNDGNYVSQTNGLYVCVMGIGSALGRVFVGYIEMLIQKRKAKREAWRSVKLRETGLSPETEPLVEHELLSSITILLPLPPLFATITAFLMAVSTPGALGFLFAANAFAFGSSWAIFILSVREIFAVDVGKNYNFCFSSGVAASFALNSYLFGGWFDDEMNRQNSGNAITNSTTFAPTTTMTMTATGTGVSAASPIDLNAGTPTPSTCPEDLHCSGNVCIYNSMLVLGAISFTALIVAILTSWWWLRRKRRLIKH